MSRIYRLIMCLTVIMLLITTSVFANAETDGNSVPPGFVDEGNIALQEILDYFPDETIPNRSTFALSRAAVSKKKIEVVFVVDATGSMSSAISKVKTNIASFAQCFSGEQYTLRLGLIEYKDTTVDGMNSTIIHTVGNTPWMNTTSFISELQKVSVDGGGDGPETPIDAMGYLTGSGFSWSSDAYKYAVLVTDADYKVTNRHGIASLNQLGQMLSDREIHTSVITSSSYYDDYGEFAAQTGGIVDDIYGNFGSMLIAYANSIMEEVQSTASYTMRALDAVTGLPIRRARITGASTMSFITDDKGMVTMELKSNELDNLVVSAEGYETIRNFGCTLAQGTITDVRMSMISDEDGDMLLSVNDFVNPGTGESNVAGPSIKVFGKNIELLKFPVKVDFRLFDKGNIKIEYDHANKSIKFMIGPYAKAGAGDPSYWTDEWKSIQNMVKTFTGKKLQADAWNQFQKARKWAKNAQKFGFPAEGYVLGYGTVSWASGEPQLTESGLLMALKTTNLLPVQWRLVPIAPWAFAKFGTIVEASATTRVYRNAEGKIGWFDNIKVKGDVKPSLSVNAGAEKVAYAGIGLEGDLGVSANFPFASFKKSFEADLSGSVFIELKILGFRNKWSEKFAELNLYPDFGTTSTSWSSYALRRSAEDNYEVIPRAQRRFALRGPSLPASIYKDMYVYSDSRPTIFALDDGRMMVLWLRDDEDRDSINKSALAYSIYDGKNWTTPQIIEDDGTADYIYSAIVDQNKVYVLWEDAEKEFSEHDTLNDVAENISLSYSVFENDAFSAAVQITNMTGNAMLMPAITSQNGKQTIVWAENDQNDPTLSGGLNTIYYSVYTSDGWSPVQIYAENVEQLQELIIGSRGTDTVIGYVDNSGEQSRVMASINMNKPEEVFGAEMIGGLQFAGGKLYWDDEKNIYSAAGLDSYDVEIENPQGAKYRVLCNGTSAAILFEQPDGYVINTGVYYAEGDGWSDPVMLTDDAGRNELISGFIDHDNEIVMAYQHSILSGDSNEPIESSHMLVSRYVPTSRMIVDPDLYYDSMDVIPNGELKLVMAVKNEGTASASGLRAVLMNEDNGVISSQEIASMEIGEEAYIEFTYQLPATIRAQTLTAELRTPDGKVVAGENVRAIAEIGYGDLAITSLELVRTGSEVKATARIVNEGYRAMRNNELTVKVGGEVGTVVSSRKLEGLNPGEEMTVEVPISAANLKASNQYDYKIIRFEVASESDEAVFYNNVMEKLLDPIPLESVKLDKQNLEIAVGQSTSIGVTCLPETAANKSVVWHCDNLDVLNVDPETGKITALKEGSATVTAVSEHGNLSDSCLVIVGSGSLSVRSVSITGATEIALGDNIVLTAVIEPDTALNKTVQWFCDNDNCVLTPGPDGTVLVEGLKEGQSKITVVTADGGYTSEITVTVINMVPFQITEQPKSVNATVGTPAEFEITVAGGKEPYTYQWEILNEGKWQMIEGENENVLRIAATTLDDNGKTFRCRVADSTRKDLISDEVILSVIPAMLLPNTGDNSNMMLWCMAMLASVACVFVINKRMHA